MNVIEIKELTRRYGKTEAVNGLNLQVRTGCCYGFFGRNGAGKTTTIKCLLNLLQPDSGTLRVFGLDPRQDEVAVKSRIGYVPDAVAFYPWMTVRDTLEYFASFRAHWNGDIEADLLGRFGLDPTKKTSALSKGQKTQLALISAICPEPELLVLDEPTSGLDPIVRREFIETMIGTYQSSDPENRTVFVSTHLISEFEGLIDDFTIIEQGRESLAMRADDARDRFKKIRVRFSDVPGVLDWTGALQVKQNGREAEVLANGNSEPLMEMLIWMAFRNYQQVHVGWRMWLRNLLAISSALFFGFSVSATIYHRPWELIMALEPRHGPARLRGSIRPRICSPDGSKIFALLPDGRLWSSVHTDSKELNQYEEVTTISSGGERKTQRRKIRVQVPVDGVFLGSSNWVSVANSFNQVFGIQSDGSLWKLFTRGFQVRNDLIRPVIPQQERIGTESDCKTIFVSDSELVGIKADGSVWKQIWDLTPDFWIDWKQGKHPDPVRWDLVDGTDWLDLTGYSRFRVVLRQDGTLWGAGFLRQSLFGKPFDREFDQRFRQIGEDSGWLAVTHFNRSFLAIQRNGTLIRNDVNGTSIFWPGNLQRPSEYSDWIALDMYFQGNGIALAADGTLSAWGEPHRVQSLLGPTRRPLWSINILAQRNVAETAK